MNWLERQLQLASERVASWPEWKQKLMREINRLREEREMSEGKKFTCLFNGQPSDFEGNPFHSDTPFGRATAISCSDLFDETEKLQDEITRLEAGNVELAAALKITLRFIENTESDLGIVLDSGNISRTALANAEKE